jgi:hypothetical protein
MAQAKQDLQAIINDAAAREGVDPELMQKIGGSESGHKATAKNPKSTAKGLFQFVDKTWAEMGGKPGQQYDPQKNAELGAKYVKKNVEALSSALGREPSHGEVYAAHFFGTTGAKTLLTKADPNAPIEQSLALFESPKRVKKVLEQNPNLQGKTTAEVLASLDAKMGSKKPSATVQEPTPKSSPGWFRSPVPHFIRSEAGSLGTGYNAALALMGMSDDELSKAQETVAQNEEDNAVADFGQAKQMLAGVQAPNAFANRAPTRMMAQGGEVKKYADGGFVVPTQRNIYRPEDQKYLDEQIANWDKYNAQANDYNTKLAAYQGSEPVKQYGTAVEAYNAKLKDYNTSTWEPYKAQVDAYNAKLAAFNASPEYTAYQKQVNDYNAALTQYQKDVYDPYKAQVDTYNTGLETFKNSDPYKNYVTAAESYNTQVAAYNAAPTRTVASQVYYGGAPGGPGYLGNRFVYYRASGPGQEQSWNPNYEFVNTNPAVPYFGNVITKDVAKPGAFTMTAPTYNATAPTAPTPFNTPKPNEVKFGEVAPTKPGDFTMAPPAAPAGFGEKTPTAPTESIDAVMARRNQAQATAAKDAEQRGIAIQAANNPNQFNLAGFGAAGISAPTIALMNKGGEAKKSEHDSDAEKLFDDFISAEKQYIPPVDASFNAAPARYVEGVGMMTPPPSVMGRVGTNVDALGGNIRAGASGVAMQTPDKKIITMPGMYDVGYNTQVGPGNLDLSFQKQIKAMPGREKNYAVNARYSIPFADGGEVTPEPEKGSAKAMLKEIGRSTQYAPADLAGSPVDLINLGLKGVDAMTGTKLAQNMPVGGSEWLIEKANQMGLMDKPTGSMTENLTRMGMGVVSPTAGPRAMVAAGKAVKGTAKAALEDLSMAATGQGGSKVAQGVAKVTGLEPTFASRPKGGVSLGASSAADVPLTRIDEQLKQIVDNLDTNTEQGQAVAGFFDKKMRNYYQNQHGTADDPLYKAILEGRIQPSIANPRVVDAARAGDPDALKQLRRAYDASTNVQALGSTAVLKGMGKRSYDMEKDVEKLIKQQSPGEDTLMANAFGIDSTDLEKYPSIYGTKGFKDIVAEGEAGKLLRLLNKTDLQPHVRQAVAKGEPIYGSTGGTNRMMPPDEIRDYLFTRTPAEIKNMGVVDAAVKAKQWHIRMAEARKNPEKFSRKDLFNGTEAVLPLEKGTWVDVRTPDALSLEGNIMGHCVGGSNYCNAVAKDTTKIISLRDKKGLPHVTIQLEKTPEGFTRVAQIKGTANNTPEKYFGEINAFLDDYSAKLGKNLTITERPSYVPPQWRDK